MTAREPGESVPAFLKRIRGALSQREAAEAIGISREEWNRLERGRQGIGTKNARRIAEVFDVDEHELVRVDDPAAMPDRDELRNLIRDAAREALVDVIENVQFPRLAELEAKLPEPSPVTALIERAVTLMQSADQPRSAESQAAAEVLATELRRVSSELALLAADIEAPQSVRRRR